MRKGKSLASARRTRFNRSFPGPCPTEGLDHAQLHQGAVGFANFTIDPGNSQLYGGVSGNGNVAAVQAPLFELHGGTLKSLKLEGDNAVLPGTTVHLSDTTASLLDKVFSTDAVTRGLLVGLATVPVQVK